jgi:hypothetical protein
LTGYERHRESDLTEALGDVLPEPISLEEAILPLVLFERIPRAKADRLTAFLEASGGKVSIDEVWVTREEAGGAAPRPACPSCGSVHTQPFTHAGPGARVNMKCRTCGHLFRSSVTGR